MTRPLAEAVIRSAAAQGLRIALAESCTGGMLAAALTDVAGSSAVFERGYVTYSNAAKEQALGVSAETLAAHGAVSEPVARAMAEGARSAAGVEISLSITGVAGPGSSDRKPEGRVCFGLARPGAPTVTSTRDFGPLGRDGVRRASVAEALRMLAEALAQRR